MVLTTHRCARQLYEINQDKYLEILEKFLKFATNTSNWNLNHFALNKFPFEENLKKIPLESFYCTRNCRLAIWKLYPWFHCLPWMSAWEYHFRGTEDTLLYRHAHITVGVLPLARWTHTFVASWRVHTAMLTKERVSRTFIDIWKKLKIKYSVNLISVCVNCSTRSRNLKNCTGRKEKREKNGAEGEREGFPVSSRLVSLSPFSTARNPKVWPLSFN